MSHDANRYSISVLIPSPICCTVLSAEIMNNKSVVERLDSPEFVVEGVGKI